VMQCKSKHSERQRRQAGQLMLWARFPVTFGVLC
jgi:hypothetical protein